MKSAVERQVLFDAILVRVMDRGQAAQIATAFRHFALRQVPPAGAGTQHFATRRDLKSFGHGLLGLNTFGTSHKSVSVQKSAQYKERCQTAQGEYLALQSLQK